MNRRDFIKSSALFAGAVGAPAILKAQGAKRVVKVGLIGCGGRGCGALGNIANAAKMLRDEGTDVEIKVVAAADYFVEKARKVAEKWGFDSKFAFGGANGYKNVVASDAEVILMAAPLNFRPIHLDAAVKAGKHVFAEKGVAVDGAGCRLFIAASREAEKKGLTIVAGTQRRHQRGYRLQAKALQDCVLSPILGGNVYWNGTVPWVRPRKEGQTNAAYLCNNWLNFTELSGDHICEQHVHNIDIANWFIGRYPKTALAFGARARRISGNQYDMFSVDFDYGDDVHIHSMCRQIDGCKGGVYEMFRTKDSVISGGHVVRSRGGENAGRRIELKGDFKDGNPYDIEHYDLLRSVLKTGPYVNEGEAVAMSTACGVMGRLSAVTGQMVSLNDIIKNENSPFYSMDCVPRPVDFEKDGDVPMPQYADNQWPLPGKPWRNLPENQGVDMRLNFFTR